MRVVLTGGGTGGHVVPNIAVIEELRARDDSVELLYIGSERGPEKKMIEKLGVPFKAVPCGKLRRYFSWENFKDFFRVPKGAWKARGILKVWGPDVVFSKGGYVALPVTLGAWMLKIPVVLHESDVVPGLANKIAARFAKKICVSFEESKKYFKKKVVVTGNPVRKSILKGDKAAAKKMLGFDQHRPVLLVMGGSQGAAQINKLVREALGELVKRFQVVHVVGKGKLDMGVHRKGYKQFEYLDEELKDVYALCELVVTRGGANSLAEMGILGKKAVVIPLGTGASRGDQIENAKVMAREMGWSILEGDVDGEDFVKAVDMAWRGEVRGGGDGMENGVEGVVEVVLGGSSYV